jgi:hypothetical protein
MRNHRAVALFLAWMGLAAAQAPTGSIAGVVRDASGAAVPAARIKLQSTATGLERSAAAAERGDYSFPSLLPGEYEVTVEASGFRRAVRKVAVEAGVTTTTDFAVSVGDVNESVTVDGASPQMHYDSHAVGGVVTHSQIEELPLNGRSFIELAKLEPGVQPPSRTNSNRMLVPVLGAPGVNVSGTTFTVDGGSITSVGVGGVQMGLSQDVVQEFQVSTVNFDLATGIASAGGVNVITRSGGNDFHGAAFYFFRDHKLAAYPALARDPASPDPFFQRRQFGLALGGPLSRDRVFFFGNWERNEQRGVIDTNLVGPDFAHFSGVTPSPLFGDLLSFRLDGRISNTHTAFVRYSHDGSRSIGPLTFASNAISLNNGMPSTWPRQLAWADQSILGLTSVFRPALVNDLRFSYFFISSSVVPAVGQDCPGCLGVGAPGISIVQAGLYIGRSSYSSSLGRRFHLNDSMTWQRGTHRARFGVNWEHNRGGLLTWNDDPVTISLYSPDQARQASIPIPSAFRTLNDILQLPLQTVSVGIGDPRVRQENGGLARTWNTQWFYFQDTWRLQQRLTVNYGVGWSLDRDLNYDLTKPPFLAPILGAGGLGPTRKQWRNFSPVLGLAWSPSSNGKTVVRAGAGLFYGLLNSFTLDAERAALGPAGLGRQTFPGVAILNTLPGVPGVPVGTALDFHAAATSFTGADLMAILPSIRAGLAQSLANASPALPAIQVNKTLSGANTGLYPADFPSPSALHSNIGVQRQIAGDFVLSADFAYRHFVHTAREGLVALDLNHFNSARGPVIPKCTGTQAKDPLAICSVGAIQVMEAPGRATYKGLLLRAEKRFSRGFQVLGSYAYSSNTGTSFRNGFNLDNWLQNTGPTDFDYTQIANLAGVAQLPWRFELGLNFSYSSAPPLSAYVGQNNFNGDGTPGDLLPGTTVNAFNRGMGRADLERLVAEFNATYALTRDALGRVIPRLTLPANYGFGDNFHSLDLRLSRSFVFRERRRLQLIGEVFNVYNKANLSNYSGDLTSAAFGQPTTRATQVFGSGGPRAFQLAIRVSF